MLNISAFLGEYRKLSLANCGQFWNAQSFKQFNFLIQIIRQPIILSQKLNSKQWILILLGNSEDSVCQGCYPQSQHDTCRFQKAKNVFKKTQQTSKRNRNANSRQSPYLCCNYGEGEKQPSMSFKWKRSEKSGKFICLPLYSFSFGFQILSFPISVYSFCVLNSCLCHSASSQLNKGSLLISRKSDCIWFLP